MKDLRCESPESTGRRKMENEDKKILVIEGNPDFLETVSDILEIEGYKLVTALDGYEGLRKVREEKPDLLILDVTLPGMDGFEVCRYLRADSNTAHLPIIILTARTLTKDQMIGFEIGADDYLTKPIVPSELLTRVEALLFFAGVNVEI